MSELLKSLWAVYNLATPHEKLARTIGQAILMETERILNLAIINPTLTEITTGKDYGKIAMIKAYRDRTGKGLKESKDACEEYFKNNGLKFYEPYRSTY